MSEQPDPDGQTGEMRFSILWHLTMAATPVGEQDQFLVLYCLF